jgi:hypothetical protein
MDTIRAAHAAGAGAPDGGAAAAAAAEADARAAADAAEFASLKTFFAALQLVGSLAYGPLIDKLGTKRLLLLSFAASAAYYAGVAGAATMPGLWAAHVPTVLQHAVLAARAHVALVVDERDLPRHLGYVSVAYGVGMLFGPAAGGALGSAGSPQAAAVAAAAGSVLSLALVAAFMDDAAAAASPATAGKRDDAARAGSAPAAPAAGSWLSAWRGVLSDPSAAALFFVKLAFTLGLAVFHAVFPIVGKDRFGLDARGSGFLLSWVGGVGLVANAAVVGPAEAALGTRGVLVGTAAALVACFVGFAGAASAAQLYALCLPLVAAATVFGTVSSAAWAGLVPPALKGSATAVDMATGSGVRLFTPTAAALLYANYGYASIGVSAAACMAVAAAALVLSGAVPAGGGKGKGKGAPAAAQ